MSDVLVKGMDMPTACRHGKCNFACSAAYQTGLICIVRKQYVVPGDVPIDCPCSLVPPHGRLIDADALWVEINKICDRRDAGIITDLTCIQQILSSLRHAPTIIEESRLPVLHGTFAASSKEEAVRRLTGENE